VTAADGVEATVVVGQALSRNGEAVAGRREDAGPPDGGGHVLVARARRFRRCRRNRRRGFQIFNLESII
jgi:hypothetical protein